MRKIIFAVIMSLVMIFMGMSIQANERYSIVVNKRTNCVTIYNSEGEPIKAMICSVGENPGDTPTGVFETSNKYRWRLLYGDVYGQYATRICGHILFHSVYYKEQSEDTLQTEEYNKLGTAASMGCIRLTAADSKWIYDNCDIGTRVTILNADSDPLPRPDIIKLGENAKYPRWDPTDPSQDNPWKNEKVKFTLAAEQPRINSEDKLTSEELGEVLRDGVKAYDIAGNEIHFDISCNLATSVKGTYDIKYFAQDALGNYGEAYTQLIIY